MATTFKPPRRITTINVPLPAHLASLTEHTEPAVQIVDETLAKVEEFDRKAARHTVFTHDTIPTSNRGGDIVPKELNNTIIAPKGANIRFNDLAPHACIPWHRTTTTDYNIFLFGSPILLTPKAAFAGEKPPADEILETYCNPGDVCLQRGTLHAWENRTDEWIRWISIMIGAEPTEVEIEGSRDDTKTLPDAWVPI